MRCFILCFVSSALQVSKLCNVSYCTAHSHGNSHGTLCLSYILSKLTSFVYTILPFLLMKAGLGLPDIDSWNMIEKIAERNNLGYKQLVSQTATFDIENWLL